jgi:hypothetical protein
MRLAPSELASASFVSAAQDVRGRWNGDGRYVDAPGAVSDRELRLEVRAMGKIGRSFQFGTIVPWVRTERRFAESAGAGSGVGDVTLLSRYDFVRVGGQNGIPGIALTFAATLPTGRPPDRAREALGTDVTGIGTWEARPGIAIEKSWWTGWFVQSVVSAGFFGPYQRSDGANVALGPRLLALIAGGKSFSSGFAFALGASHEREAGPRVDGVRTNLYRSRTSAIGMLSYELDDHWQTFATVLIDIPIRELGREQTAGTTFGLGIRRAWNVYD